MVKKDIISYRFEHGISHHPVVYELINMGRKLENDSDYLELGGDGDSGENIAMLISEAVEAKEKKGYKLMWVEVDDYRWRP